MKRTLPVLLILVLAFVSGCSKPQPVFEQYVDAVQKGDFDAATALRVEKPEGGIGPTFNPDQGDDLKKVWFSKIKVENIETKIEGETASVTLRITAPDLGITTKQTMGDMMGAVMASAFSNAVEQDKSKSEKDMKELQEMALAKMIATIQKDDVITSTKNGTATLVKVNGDWKIFKLNVDWGWDS